MSDEVEQALSDAEVLRKVPREHLAWSEVQMLTLADEVLRLRSELGDTTSCDACAALKGIVEESQ